MRKYLNGATIIVEPYQLDTGAGGCSGEGSYAFGHSDVSCFEDIGGWFSGEVCANDAIYPGGDNNDKPCYHGVIATGVVFFAS